MRISKADLIDELVAGFGALMSTIVGLPRSHRLAFVYILRHKHEVTYPLFTGRIYTPSKWLKGPSPSRSTLL